MNWFSRWRRAPQPQAGATSTVPPASAAGTAALFTQIDALVAGGSIDEAEALLERPVGPALPAGTLLLARARILRGRGQCEEALALCDQALGLDGDAALVHLELAHCRRARHDVEGAIDALNVALTLQPALGRAWLLLGEILLKQERPAEAGDALVKALPCLEETLRPEAWFHLAQAMIDTGRSGKACEALHNCIRLNPELAGAHIALGHALLMEEDESGAIASYRQAMSLLKSAPYNLRLNLSIAHMNRGDYREARDLLETLCAEQPGNHVARWYRCQLDLLQCRWSQGWANYPARFGAGSSPYRPMPYRPWAGEPLGEHEPLLVLADQGLGDEIMFASCLPDVLQRAKTCIVECEPRLLPLFARSFPAIHFVATQRESTTQWLRGLPAPARQIAAGDLPSIFRHDDTAFPQHHGYLRADPERVAHWRQELASRCGAGLKVGISWRGGIARTRAKARSLDAEQLRPILQVPHVQFVNLQYGDYATELAEINALYGDRIHDFPEAIAHYDDTAALVAALDVVVTVCTAIVHLAGSLGKPVWVLTPHAPGWRYTADRHALPWYPSSRIFRQPNAGNWPLACEEVSLALQHLTNTVTSGAPQRCE